jgi:hypothetical protein
MLCALADNVHQHLDDRVTDAIRATGALLIFLPTYSPEWNPVFFSFLSSFFFLSLYRAPQVIPGVFPELKRVVSSPGATWTANAVAFGGFPFDLADSSRISARRGFRALFFLFSLPSCLSFLLFFLRAVNTIPITPETLNLSDD